MKKRGLALLLALCLLLPALPARAATARTAFEAATTLYALGLFQGTGQNADGTPIFELSAAPTRADAVTMLVRLLGKENLVRAGAADKAWSAPFTDMPDWAAPYISYAYETGLVRGTARTRFGSADAVSANDYCTFVLRALGYDDDEGDFSWDTAATFAASLGLAGAQYGGGLPFTRGDVAKISCAALPLLPKGKSVTLLSNLVSEGAVTAEAVQSAGLTAALAAPEKPKESGAELTAAQVYAACSPAVFYIEIYNANHEPTSSGSGFFISADGRAVTNYHVVDDATYAVITMADGKTTHKVTGVYDYDAAQDVALLQIEGSGFPYLREGAASSVVGGAPIYAIGSPLGLDNTISGGIIANPHRRLDGTDYIQFSAAISAGSSGGALLNGAGKVIGITAAGIDEGQNLNFAVPYSSAKKLATTTLRALSTLPRLPSTKPDGGSGSGSGSGTGGSGSGSGSGTGGDSWLGGEPGSGSAAGDYRFFTDAPNALRMVVGETVTVNVTQTYHRKCYLKTGLDIDSTVRLRWGEWSEDGSTIPLTITALKPLGAVITLSLYDCENDFHLDGTMIDVFIRKKA